MKSTAIAGSAESLADYLVNHEYEVQIIGLQLPAIAERLSAEGIEASGRTLFHAVGLALKDKYIQTAAHKLQKTNAK